MPIARFSLVALDCPDALALAEFYRQIVGGEVEPQTEEEDDWVLLKLPDSSDLAFQQVADHRSPDWPDGGPQQLEAVANV